MEIIDKKRKQQSAAIQSFQVQKYIKSTDSESTSVSNVKVQYIRPKYKNLKEWMDDPTNEYIGRAGAVFIDGKRFPKKASIWANPFKVGKDGNSGEV